MSSVEATPKRTVPRVEGLSTEAFLSDYLKPSKPVIIRGAIDDWRATTLWNPDYLTQTVGFRKIAVFVSNDGMFGLDPDAGGPRFKPRVMLLREFVEAISSGDAAGQKLYAQRMSIPEALPELMSDFSIPTFVKAKQIYLTNAWFGPGGNITRLHYDVPNNFLAQVYGRKRFVLFPPEDASRLYPYRTKAYNMSQLDLDHPDWARFPESREIVPIEFVLEPGELLFLPSFWWHQVYSLEMGITINFWWWPKLRQLFAPQIGDTFVDLLKEVRKEVLKRLFTRPVSARG